jgi:hypothetical protein
MSIKILRNAIWDWAVANVPRAITFDTGSITGGYIEVNVGGTIVNTPFDSDKETTLTNLCEDILAQVDNVGEVIMYYTSGKIKIISCNNVSLTLVINNQFLGDIEFGIENAVSVIWMNENGPRPELPYISLNISTYDKAGNVSDIFPANDAGLLNSHQLIEFTLEVQSYGEESYQIVSDLYQSIDRTTVRQDLYETDNIVFFDDIGGVRDMSTLIGTHEEKRALLELRGRTSQLFTDKIGVIGTVNMELTATGIKQDISMDITTS